MREKLLKFIVCPKCKGSLDLKNALSKGEHIWEGSLSCANCKSTFPIKSGVPQLLVDSNNIYSPSNKYKYMFSEWSEGKFGEGELYGHSEEEELSDFFVAFDITPSDLRNKFILDAGCGVGRLTKNLGQFGGEVIGMDIHNAMEIPFQQSSMLKNVHIIQADLFHLPFSINFDFLWCEGVLPYVDDPREGFHRLAAMVKKGGRMYVLFYREDLKGILYYTRKIFKNANRLPPNILHILCNFLALSYLIRAYIIGEGKKLKNYVFNKRWDSKIKNGEKDSIYKFGQNRLGKLLKYYRYLSFSFYDLLLQEHVHYHRIDEVEGWFKEEEFEVLDVLEDRTGIMGIKRKESQ